MSSQPDGSYVEYHADGSWQSYDAITDTVSGGMDYDGSEYYTDFPDGSYLEYNADGSWEYYDAGSDTYSGGIDYDDALLMEIYSDVLGWGYLDDWD